MKVYLIYKRNKDKNKKDVFMSFHTNKKFTEFAIWLYDDVYITESDMTESEYNKFRSLNDDKELMMYRHHMHVGCIILRKRDYKRLLASSDAVIEMKGIINDYIK